MPHPQEKPLDPDARAVIDRLNALNAPGYETMTPAIARTVSAQLQRNAPTPQVQVGAVRQIEFGAGGQVVPVRHYHRIAEDRNAPAPALICFHGGGWTIGDLDTMDHLCRSLVRLAWIDVLSVDYPLAPETRFPTTVDICAEAVRAIFQDAARLGLDSSRIGLCGDSAGGNLAAVLALMARDGDIPPITAQCLIYPALDLARTETGGTGTPETHFMHRETMDWFVANYLPKRDLGLDWRASPLRAEDLTGLPPSIVITAGHDVLRRDGLDYAERLTAAGVPTVARDFTGQIHNFVCMPHVIPTAHVAIAEIGEFLLEHLCGHTEG